MASIGSDSMGRLSTGMSLGWRLDSEKAKHMSKYDPLWDYIRDNCPGKLTFADVEKACGIPIDHSFLRYKKELEAYGFRIGKISMKEQIIAIERLR